MSRNSCLFSIIIPLHNRFGFVKEALESLRRQSVRDFEVIFVDDGSQESFERYYQENLSGILDGAVTFLRQDNQGPHVARNTGLGAARGDYIVFLDDDDLLREAYLTECLAAMADGPDVVAVGAQFFEGDVGHVRIEKMPPEADPHTVFQGLCRENDFAIESLCVRRSLIEKVGGFSREFYYAQDWHLWLKIFMEPDLKYICIPRYLVLVRIHAGNRSQNEDQAREAKLACLEYLRKTLPADRQQEIGLGDLYVRRRIINAWYVLIGGSKREGRRRLALTWPGASLRFRGMITLLYGMSVLPAGALRRLTFFIEARTGYRNVYRQ